jgi:hypothetical protein
MLEALGRFLYEMALEVSGDWPPLVESTTRAELRAVAKELRHSQAFLLSVYGELEASSLRDERLAIEAGSWARWSATSPAGSSPASGRSASPRGATTREGGVLPRSSHGEAGPSLEPGGRGGRPCLRRHVARGSGRPPPGRAPAGGKADPLGLETAGQVRRLRASRWRSPGLRCRLPSLRLLPGTDAGADRYSDFYTLVYVPARRIIATLRSAAQCRSLANELSRVWVSWGGTEPAEDPAPLLQRFQREDT